MSKEVVPNDETSMEVIDWVEVRRSLDAAWDRTERAWVPSIEERSAILKERARRLDRRPESEASGRDIIEVVEFQLAEETYGIESFCVRVVCPLRDFAPLPCTPPFVLGLVNVRGKIVSVVDLRILFDVYQSGITESSKAIILEHGNMEFGILADSVAGARPLHLKDLQPFISTLAGYRADYFKGITKECLIVLDAVKILSDPRLVVHEEVK